MTYTFAAPGLSCFHETQNYNRDGVADFYGMGADAIFLWLSHSDRARLFDLLPIEVKIPDGCFEILADEETGGFLALTTHGAARLDRVGIGSTVAGSPRDQLQFTPYYECEPLALASEATVAVHPRMATDLPDLDGDGKKDIVFTDRSGTIVVLWSPFDMDVAEATRIETAHAALGAASWDGFDNLETADENRALWGRGKFRERHFRHQGVIQSPTMSGGGGVAGVVGAPSRHSPRSLKMRRSLSNDALYHIRLVPTLGEVAEAADSDEASTKALSSDSGPAMIDLALLDDSRYVQTAPRRFEWRDPVMPPDESLETEPLRNSTDDSTDRRRESRQKLIDELEAEIDYTELSLDWENADIDGDGREDFAALLLSFDYLRPWIQCRIYLAREDGGFPPVNRPDSILRMRGFYSYRYSFDDFDSDGDLDLCFLRAKLKATSLGGNLKAYLQQGLEGAIEIYPWHGGEGYSAKRQVSHAALLQYETTGWSHLKVTTALSGDFNRDGLRDLILQSRGDRLDIFLREDAERGFGAEPAWSKKFDDPIESVEIVDVGGDERGDLKITLNRDGKVVTQLLLF